MGDWTESDGRREQAFTVWKREAQLIQVPAVNDHFRAGRCLVDPALELDARKTLDASMCESNHERLWPFPTIQLYSTRYQNHIITPSSKTVQTTTHSTSTARCFDPFLFHLSPYRQL